MRSLSLGRTFNADASGYVATTIWATPSKDAVLITMVLSTTERVAIVQLPVETRLFMETLAVFAEKLCEFACTKRTRYPKHNEEVVRNALCAG